MPSGDGECGVGCDCRGPPRRDRARGIEVAAQVDPVDKLGDEGQLLRVDHELAYPYVGGMEERRQDGFGLNETVHDRRCRCSGVGETP